MRNGARIGIIGAGLGGLSAAACLAARGYQVDLFERHDQVGGKASRYEQDGFAFDEGPSIVVMTWVYEDLFQRAGRAMSDYLQFERLDPAFRIFTRDGQPLDICAQESALIEAVASISRTDAVALKQLLSRCDLFARVFKHDFYERMFAGLRDIICSRLLPSALVLSPLKNFMSEVRRQFQHELVRSLLIGFPIYAGLDPRNSPASLLLIPWTIIREGVWYPRGGIHEIARAIARLARDLGAQIHLNAEVSGIEVSRDLRAHTLTVNGSSARYDAIISNSDYLHTHRLLRGEAAWPKEIELLRRGEAQPSASFLTLELALSRPFSALLHHNLLLDGDPTPSYHDIFDRGQLPRRPPVYINAPVRNDAALAPAGKDNIFVVISVPPRPEPAPPAEYYEQYADELLTQIEGFDLSGLKEAVIFKRMNTPLSFEQRFFAFRGSIYGLGPQHNILYGAFRPLNSSQAIRNLYFVGGGVQPGAGMPLVVQSGKIVADLIINHRDTEN